MLQSDPDKKLPLLYLIDSIVKTAGRTYQDAFAGRIHGIVTSAVDTLAPQQQAAVARMLNTWRDTGLFIGVLGAMQAHVDAAGSGLGLRAAKRMRPDAGAGAPHMAPPQPSHGDGYAWPQYPVHAPPHQAGPYGAPPQQHAAFASGPADPYASFNPAPAPAGPGTSMSALRGIMAKRATPAPPAVAAAAPPASLPEAAREAATRTAAAVPAVMAPVFAAIASGVQAASAQQREYASGEATRAVAKVNPGLAAVLVPALAAVPPAAAVLAAPWPQLYADPFIAAVQAAVWAQRADLAAGAAGGGAATAGAAGGPTDAPAAAAAGMTAAPAAPGGAALLASLRLPTPELTTATARGFGPADAAVLYDALPAVSVRAGWRFGSAEEAQGHEAVADAHERDREERGVTSRAWWPGSVDAWAGWRRVRPRKVMAGTPFAAGRAAGALGWVAYDTLDPPFFTLDALEREAAEAAAGGGTQGPEGWSPADDGAPGVPAAGREAVCVVCGDAFETRVDESTGETWLRDAVDTEAGPAHPQCGAAPAQAATPAPASRTAGASPSGGGEGSPSALGMAGLM